jgi:hypothetical protein
LRPQVESRALGGAQSPDRTHGREVLGREAGPVALRPDTLKTHALAGDRGQGDRGADQLPSALAERAVDLDHPIRPRRALMVRILAELARLGARCS